MPSNVRANFAKGMVNDAYDYAMESYMEKPLVYPEIFNVGSTDGSYEQYTTLISPGTLQDVAEGQTIPRVNTTEGFTVYCAVKKQGYELPITNEANSDNRKMKNMLKSWANGIGEATRVTQENRHADIFNYGGFTAGNSVFNNDILGVLSTGYGSVCYDSIPFFALTGAPRTAKHGGTYYNGVASLPLNETNLQIIFRLISITNAYDEAGKRVEIAPDTLVCKFGSDTWFAAKRILESAGSPDATHSGVTNLWKGKLNLVGWSALTDDDAWFMGVAKKGLRSLSRMPLAIDYYEEKSTDSDIVRCKVRYGACVDNFRYWAGTNFATS